MSAPNSNALIHTFYIWPQAGIHLSHQWDNLRENFANLHPMAKAMQLALDASENHEPKNNDLSGLAHGERDFRNRYRIWYDPDNDRWALQINVGTEAEPQWDDYLTVRDSDGRVTIWGTGGIDSSVGGFYAPLPRNLAKSAVFPLSNEWIFEHDLNTTPVLWDTFDDQFISIVPYKTDVSDPNIAYFYYLTPKSGTAMAVAEQARGEGIRISDGTNVFPGANRLGFNPADFYLSKDGHGKPVVNLQPIDISAIDPDSIPVNLIVTDTDGNQSFDLSTISNPKIVLNRNDFYFGSDINGNPIVNIRGSFGSGGSTGNTAASAGFTASTEWVLNHNLNNIDLNWATYDDQGLAIIPSKVSVHDPNTTYFYFGNNAMTGRAVVTAAGGTSTIDTSPFIRKDGTITFTGDQSMGGFKLTNVGAPTVGGDAANKTYVDAHSLTVSDSVHSLAATTLNFSAGGFYLSQTTSGQPMVNLRYDADTLPVFVEFPTQQNIVVDPVAPYTYTIERVAYDNKGGSCTMGFYIMTPSTRNKNGISVVGLDPLAVSTTLKTTAPTGANTVNAGDMLVLSIFQNSSSKHLRVSLTAKKT